MRRRSDRRFKLPVTAVTPGPTRSAASLRPASSWTSRSRPRDDARAALHPVPWLDLGAGTEQVSDVDASPASTRSRRIERSNWCHSRGRLSGMGSVVGRARVVDLGRDDDDDFIRSIPAGSEMRLAPAAPCAPAGRPWVCAGRTTRSRDRPRPSRPGAGLGVFGARAGVVSDRPESMANVLSLAEDSSGVCSGSGCQPDTPISSRIFSRSCGASRMRLCPPSSAWVVHEGSAHNRW